MCKRTVFKVKQWQRWPWAEQTRSYCKEYGFTTLSHDHDSVWESSTTRKEQWIPCFKLIPCHRMLRPVLEWSPKVLMAKVKVVEGKPNSHTYVAHSSTAHSQGIKGHLYFPLGPKQIQVPVTVHPCNYTTVGSGTSKGFPSGSESLEQTLSASRPH